MGMLESKQPSHVSYLSFGSNIGDRLKNLLNAVTILSKMAGIKIIDLSNIYDTAPQNFQAQQNFLNCVAKISTTLSPHELLKVCQKIEQELGRIRYFRYGPRIIDVDILLFDNQTIQEEDLVLPHPELINRNCILSPLSELTSELVIDEHTVEFWLKKCSNQPVKKISHEQQRCFDVFRRD
ncbi:MAG: 2-amino-4-hydroxy-6-hydroxymethyldihydropteridine diphosphokinase [Opitutales bacterium]|nr:2-amino-4-hydroxy-6-hydroxymethyldihydropteridine diphosphokinase [Opitutales bacterium]